MYRLYFLLILLSFPWVAFGQTPFPVELTQSAKKFKKAKVRKVQVYTQNEGEDKKRLRTTLYNKKGFPTQDTTINKLDEKEITDYTYNKKHQLVRQQSSALDGKLLKATLYQYNKKNLVYEKHDSDYSYSVTYIYDEQGRIDSTYIPGAEFRKNDWIYENGRLHQIIGYTVYDLDNPDNWVEADKQTLTYNDKGLVIKDEDCRSSWGCSQTTYTYDKKQRLHTKSEQSPSATIGTTTFSYNKKGLLSKEVFEADESMQAYFDSYTKEYVYSYK